MSEPSISGISCLKTNDPYAFVPCLAVEWNTLAYAVAAVAVLAITAVAAAFTEISALIVIGGVGSGYLIYRAIKQYQRDNAKAEFELSQRSDLDKKTSDQWLKKAAEDRHPAAMREYAKKLQYSSPYEARKLFFKAAKAGDAEAQTLAKLPRLEVLFYKLNLIKMQNEERISIEELHECAAILINTYLKEKDNKALEELPNIKTYVIEQITSLDFNKDMLLEQAKNKRLNQAVVLLEGLK